MNLHIKLTGVTPLLMHNPRLSDPKDPIVRQMKELLAKKSKMTDSERDQMEDLEFMGGLYYDKEIGPYVESIAVLRTMHEAAKITRQGKDLLRAISPLQPTVPLLYDGPRKAEQLKADPQYRLRTSVGNKMNRVMRTRPMFRNWALEFDGVMLEDAGLNKASIPDICATAGRSVGLLDGRIIGYGRFTSEVRFSNGSV